MVERFAGRMLMHFTMLLLLWNFAQADGVILPSLENWKMMRERAFINEPEQKAVLFFSKGKEDLIISPSYEGPSSNFAWVIPVPARPKVEILKGAIFHELAKLVAPKPAALRGGGMIQKGAPVTLLERKTVGAYDVSVLSATDGQALMKWLTANGYYLSPQDLPPVQSYVKEGWTFVACRIKVPEQAKGLRTGTLAPLQLTFPAKLPIYPIRLSSANPKPFSVLIYLVLPKSEIGRKMEFVTLATGPGMKDAGQTRWQAEVKWWKWWNRKRYPTLAKLSKEELHVFVERSYLQPGNCTKDYVWASPTR